MTMKRITILAVLTLNLTLCLPLHAQLSPDALEDLSGDAPPQPSDVPVDGGLSLLLAVGAAFGSRRLISGVRSTSVTKSDKQYP